MKRNLIMTLLATSLVIAGCNQGKEEKKDDTPFVPESFVSFTHVDAPEGAITKINDLDALLGNDTYVSFPSVTNGYGIEFHQKEDNELISYNDNPVIINVRGPETGLIASFTEKTYSFPYEAVKSVNYGYLATAVASTDNGSKIYFEDSYYIEHDGGINFNRSVQVIEANEKKDLGFSTTFSLINGFKSRNTDDFEYFIPAILYKDTSNLSASAIANNLYLDKVYVKETRMGLPMAMMRHIEKGFYTSLSHSEPKISANGLLGGGASGDIDNRIQYGAFGYTMSKMSIDFIYPCAEGPVTYDCGATWARRYHPVTVETAHSYKLAISNRKTETFNDAVVDSYKVGYENIDMTVEKFDNRTAYLQNIELFRSEYREFGTGDIKSAGFPWELKLNKSEIKREYSFQYGFVGMQSSAGAHMYREGLSTSDADLIKKGKTIIDFWSSQTIHANYFPYVWWDAGNNTSGGQNRSYSCYLRCMVDGVQGVLDAYEYGLEHGIDNTSWLDTVKEFADRLVDKQNADGSFYRAYTTSGNVAINANDSKLHGDSKLNTPIAIRFLGNFYNLTKDNKYKTAALRAAEFAYTEIYEKLGKYVGGTPDNPNVVDKEAAFYALYGFRYAYELSNDEKFLKAMVHAAVCSLSWVFVYDFACPGDSSVAGINPFEKEGHIVGFSVIATGHGASDNFSSWLWYDLYKVYELTNIDYFKRSAILIENACKLNTDYYGELGYLYRCMMPEASTVSEFNFKSVRVWLPWASVANMNPIIYTLQDYGVWSLEEISNQ